MNWENTNNQKTKQSNQTNKKCLKQHGAQHQYALRHGEFILPI